MRPIEFRVFNVTEKRIINDEVYIDKDGNMYWDLGWDGLHPFNNEDKKNYVLCQFTGLLDKAGKKIFEGDILKYFATGILAPDYPKLNECIGTIEWNDEDLRYDLKVARKNSDNFHCFQPSKSIDDNNFEIIGNIYENPELMQPVKDHND